MQTFDQTLRVILSLIEGHKTHHSLKDTGAERIRVSLPSSCQHGQSFFVEVCAIGLVLLEGGADADDLPWGTVAVQTQLQAGAFGGVQEGDSFGVLAKQSRTQLCAGGQRCGNAGLPGKEDGFFLLRQPVVHLADDGEVCTSIHGFAGHEGVLPIKNVVVTIPVADLGRVGDPFGELCGHPLNVRDAQFPLVFGRDLQIGAVEDLLLIRPLRKERFNNGFIGDLRHGAEAVQMAHIVSSNLCR